jgi:hypothetical protein
MTATLDLITNRNLVLVRQIYQRAVVQSASQHSDVDRILSLISFDLANETLLKNAITAVDARAKYRSDLNELITKADEVFANASPIIPPVPDTQKIKRVRNIRNGAMHEAKYPTAADINDCRTYTKDFLQQMVMNVWDISFESLSLTDVIKNQTVKGFLVKAETELANVNHRQALVNAIAGFSLTVGKVRKAIVGETPKGVDAFMMLDYNQPQPSKNVLESFKSIQNIVLQSIIGLDHISYIKYKRVTRLIGVFIMGDGHLSVNFGKDPDKISPTDIDFVVNFAINSVIQIESLVGDIDDPFGHNKWWEEGND